MNIRLIEQDQKIDIRGAINKIASDLRTVSSVSDITELKRHFFRPPIKLDAKIDWSLVCGLIKVSVHHRNVSTFPFNLNHVG